MAEEAAAKKRQATIVRESEKVKKLKKRLDAASQKEAMKTMNPAEREKFKVQLLSQQVQEAYDEIEEILLDFVDEMIIACLKRMVIFDTESCSTVVSYCWAVNRAAIIGIHITDEIIIANADEILYCLSRVLVNLCV